MLTASEDYYRCRAIGLVVACLLICVGTASVQELFYEDFADTTLATGGSQQSGTIASGIISYNDASAMNRARFVVVPTQTFADPVMTFSFDVACRLPPLITKTTSCFSGPAP